MKEFMEIKTSNKEVKMYSSDDGKVKSERLNKIINYEHSQRFSVEKFYEKYKTGIDEANAGKALAEAEQIINAHPEYMLHMMNMYSDLAKAA